MVVLVGGTLAFPVYWVFEGRLAAFDEVRAMMIALSGGIAGLLAVFLFNLICAPYRIVKEEREKLSVQLSSYLNEDGDVGDLSRRETFSLALIASLMSPNKRKQEQYLIMLKDDVLYEKLHPVSLGILKMHLTGLRYGLNADGRIEIPDSLEISREELRRYFAETSGVIPNWLEVR